MSEYLPLLLLLLSLGLSLLGYPIALTLAGTALWFAMVGMWTGRLESDFWDALPGQLHLVLVNETLASLPLFLFIGYLLEKSRVTEVLFDAMSQLFGGVRAGLGYATLVTGSLLVLGVGVVSPNAMGLGVLALPAMLRRGYDPGLAMGITAVSGSVGRVIPPSILLVVLGIVLSTAYQQAQLEMGAWAAETLSVGDLFAGTLIPGFILGFLGLAYLMVIAMLRPSVAPGCLDGEVEADQTHGKKAVWISVIRLLLPLLLLVIMVLGPVLTNRATPAEAAALGVLGMGTWLWARGSIDLAKVGEALRSTARTSGGLFLILTGAAIFLLVFRGYGGGELASRLLNNAPGGAFGAALIAMILLFGLGLLLDFVSVAFVMVPIVAPVLLAMGIEPIWLGVMVVMVMQLSLLTPPWGLGLVYLRQALPADMLPSPLYRGLIPFLAVQLLVVVMVAAWPDLATWLPNSLNEAPPTPLEEEGWDLPLDESE